MLKLDWCSRQAALYAVTHWHYARSLSTAKNVYIGVWEDNGFAGCVVFGLGAGRATSGKRFGLRRAFEVAELTRVALKPGHHAPVSRVVAIAIRLLCQQSPGLRLLISFADPAHGHHGGIYQAGNWIYAGLTNPKVQNFLRGRWVHHRTATSAGSAWRGLPSRPTPGKHRYLMPLDAEMRARILPLAQPYPTRAGSIGTDAPADQAGEGAATRPRRSTSGR